jgi:hypothetical protein
MTTIIDYKPHYVVLIDDPQLVEGVEIETRKEREAREWFERNFAARVKKHIDQAIEDAFYGTVRLPPP